MSIRELFQIPAIFEWVSSFIISKSPLTPLCTQWVREPLRGKVGNADGYGALGIYSDWWYCNSIPHFAKGGLGGICIWDLQLICLCAVNRVKLTPAVFSHMNSQGSR